MAIYAGSGAAALPLSRAEQLLQGLVDAPAARGRRAQVPVARFLALLAGGSAPAAAARPASSAAAAAAGPTLGGPDLDRPEWRAASHKERERALQKRSGPADRLRRMVLAQRADSLGEEEQRLLLQLRETLFERRSNMARMFRSVDLNNDGAVTLEEFLHALEGSGVATGHELDRAHNFVTEEEAARMMAFFDRDGQGLLRYNEFIRLLQGNLERPPPGGWRPSRQAFAET
ncbi:unnamed protein product [Prorocentrum cordatum]|uniref:EF-hand domain-containing protein n=1 Tax=Prorocentrum cordatum TaxID=2364126 RepID=A0ABN9RDY4_9DINO|nr:unnamed protein product [Polarella glacialis]